MVVGGCHGLLQEILGVDAVRWGHSDILRVCGARLHRIGTGISVIIGGQSHSALYICGLVNLGVMVVTVMRLLVLLLLLVMMRMRVVLGRS